MNLTSCERADNREQAWCRRVTSNSYFVALRTVRNLSRKISAWAGVNTRAGLRRIDCSPHPPLCTPCKRSRFTRSSRSLGVAQVTAKNVPRPRAELIRCGNSFSNWRSPLYSFLPDASTRERRLSRLMTLRTCSRRINLDGSPIHVLNTRYGCWGLWTN